jgi:hypothetical protein
MQTVTKEQIQNLLRSNDWAVVRGVEAIYARQTSDERASQTTSHDNGRGFNGRDAGILSSFAKQIQGWRSADPVTRYRFPLSPKQLGVARRAIFKYAGQLAVVAAEKSAAETTESAIEAAVERSAIQEVENLAPVVESDPDLEPLSVEEEEFLSLA